MPIKTRIKSKDVCLWRGKATYYYQTVEVGQPQAQKAHVIWGTQLSHYCLSSPLTPAGNCLSTCWCTWIMRPLHLWNNHHTTRPQPWAARHSRCPSSSSTGGLSSSPDLGLLLFGANMLVNQRKTNSANSRKFICTIFKPTLTSNFLISNFQFEIWDG